MKRNQTEIEEIIRANEKKINLFFKNFNHFSKNNLIEDEVIINSAKVLEIIQTKHTNAEKRFYL